MKSIMGFSIVGLLYTCIVYLLLLQNSIATKPIPLGRGFDSPPAFYHKNSNTHRRQQQRQQALYFPTAHPRQQQEQDEQEQEQELGQRIQRWNLVLRPSKRENELDGWQVFSNEESPEPIYQNDPAAAHHPATTNDADYMETGSRGAAMLSPRTGGTAPSQRHRKKVLLHTPSRRTMLCALLKYVVQMRQKKKHFSW